MKRFDILPAIAALGITLLASGPASAAEVGCIYNGALQTCIYYPGYANASPQQAYELGAVGATEATAPLWTGRSAAVAADTTAPLMTSRSVAAAPVPGAVAGPGYYCATSERTCLLKEPGWLGTGCSCRVPGGRAQGFVK